MTRAFVIDGWRIDVTTRPGTHRLMPAAEVARVASAALAAAGAPSQASLSVILTDDAELADLNETHLGHRGPTDVLSFPLLAPEAFPGHAGGSGGQSRPVARVAFPLPPRTRLHLGDIAVSVERAIAQASEGRGGHTGRVQWAPADELRLLLTHGTLHICGWDHAAKAEEIAMRALERQLLGVIAD